MTLKKEHLIYAGVGVLVILVILSSTKEVQLREVKDSDVSGEKKTFDSTELPPGLRPPYRLATGESIPAPARRKFTLGSISLKPRFDNNDF